MISIEEAFELIDANVAALGTETVALADAVGRVLAQPIIADVNSPPHTKSVMDGYAVMSADITSGVQLKVLETIIAGDNPMKEMTTGTCSRIMTGAPLPAGSDAVVMVEMTETVETDGESFVRINLDNIDAGRHVMQKASSFGKGETIFAVGHHVRPLDIGLLAEVGAHHPLVNRCATACVLPTGNELVDSSELPGEGQIRNSNGPMLVALLQDRGIQTTNLGIGIDDSDELRAKIAEGLQSDLLILSGGVSAGTMDLVPEVLQESGVVELFHKVKIKPGKPIWFGKLERSNGMTTYVFGLPGNPVSSLIGFRLFVVAAIRKINGYPLLRERTVSAILAEPHEARGDRPTYWPGHWQDDERPSRQVRPLRWMGSSDLRALGTANALIYFPADKSLYLEGETVQVLSF